MDGPCCPGVGHPGRVPLPPFAASPSANSGRLVSVEAGPAILGLTSAEAAERLAVAGPNVLPTQRPPSPVRLLLGQMTHFFAVMLWVAAALAWIAQLPQLSVAIAVVIVLNGTFAFVQEYRASRTAQRLLELLPVNASVIRDGHPLSISASELVVGDVVLLEAGDRICADCSVIQAAGLAVDESMLTGESVPARRENGDRVFAGTFVTEGESTVEVETTGAGTRLAEIAVLSRTGERPRSPLADRLTRVVRVVALIALGVGVGFFGIALLLGTPPRDGFLFAVGVTVALVPEGLLPTVTLSLALGARRMAERHALVRSLESVETLGSTTFLCTDKTGTLTRNEMAVVSVWTPAVDWNVEPLGYDADVLVADPPASVVELAVAATLASTGRIVHRDGQWQPHGDPMEAALHVLALRLGVGVEELRVAPTRRLPFDPRRRRVSTLVGGRLVVKGAVDSMLARCHDVPPDAARMAAVYAERGLRVLAVAARSQRARDVDESADTVESDLELLGIVGLEDPPRDGAADAVEALRRADVKVAMVTGDHPSTARAIAEEVGLLLPGSLVIEACDLPQDRAELGAMLDHDGVVVARAEPEDKLRIAEALQARGHVVAMTGDGVNDGPALSRADIGIALGRSGTDVARETADLVLLDDHLATVVVAVEMGRTTFMNVRRFLTYHLTDNVAELTPFVVWALSGGSYPLALSVLQVLALDIGTDLLPAIALGVEPPNARILEGPLKTDRLIDRHLLARVFGVLGPAEAVGEMVAFTAVLLVGGWKWGVTPSVGLLAAASGAAFAAVVLGQMANAFACRSSSRWVGALLLLGNRGLLAAVAFELLLLLAFLGLPPMQSLLGGGWPTSVGWAFAFATVPLLLAADTVHKVLRSRRHRGS